MADLTDRCKECDELFTIGDWATLYVDGWIHKRCKPKEPLAHPQLNREKAEVNR